MYLEQFAAVKLWRVAEYVFGKRLKCDVYMTVLPLPLEPICNVKQLTLSFASSAYL